jgi:Mg/Co/Ni transporter MgtE
VAKEIAELKDPESAKAVIEISAVVKNLTVEPTTPQQIAELVRYLDKDDVVLDVSEFASDIRTPLLKVLAQLHKAVSA